jgi:subtilisin family serine protease
VLGICHGDNNAIGITGIAYEAALYAASADFNGEKWNAAAAIREATKRLHAGDLILLEMHAPGPHATSSDDPTQKGFIPVEYWRPEFAAIRLDCAKGIYVIEAAGNGGEDLDDPVYANAFSRKVRDSGAIVVGAGNSPFNPAPRSRISWSNYGSRVDVQGWGFDIVTAGGRSKAFYHDRVVNADPSRCYTRSFGGTSGASPIVTGAVACISGAIQAAGLKPLKPSAMRDLLSSTGSPETDTAGFPISQRIGPLPDIKAALNQLDITATNKV